LNTTEYPTTPLRNGTKKNFTQSNVENKPCRLPQSYEQTKENPSKQEHPFYKSDNDRSAVGRLQGKNLNVNEGQMLVFRQF